MAKYVLVAFENDREADEFVATHRDVVGVWRRPTQFCECVSVKRRGFTRGKKWGWWVCSQCAKPTEGWAQGDHWSPALGRNLLRGEND